MKVIPKDQDQKIKASLSKSQNSRLKWGFLQKTNFDGFDDPIRFFAGDHPRYIPRRPSNLSLKENPIKLTSN
jgi:hypothetical protein